MERETMHAWIQRCPSCGYCAYDVTEFDDRYRAVLEGPAYRSQLADRRYPELASTFICAGMLAEASGSLEQAASARLHAAWVLEDEGNFELARVCRGSAADTFLALLAEGHSCTEQPGAYETIVADCLRRAGRGAEALPLIEQALGQEYEDSIRSVLTLQQKLIQRGDARRHLMSEALKDLGA